MPLPPLSNLRKGVVFFAFFLFCFILYRLFFYETATDFPEPQEEAPDVYTDMCLLVVSGMPMNVDTVFSLKNGTNKIFAYSYLEAGFKAADTLWHIWYYEDEEVKKIECQLQDSACFSSLSADSLKSGEWSVDIRQGNILLSVKQFSIEE
ncbi:MAG: DUF2914 domain-containing protein [Fibromonadaceae bacterium]|jgi:hypothetical protein|nr:DUF2914 domain-containing protein [Fibromonadaceae bacterium]